MTNSERIFHYFVEPVCLLILFAGLAQLIQTFNRVGYLPAPFVFDVGDTFMDWFNTAYWAHNPGAYSVWQTVYLPLSFIVTRMMGDPRCYSTAPYDARDCDVFGIGFILVMYVTCIVVSAVALRRRDPSTALMRTLAIAVGGPLLFSLERGNLIMLAYIVFVILYGDIIKSKLGIAAASAVLFNLKIYMLLPMVAFAVKRNWRTLELCLIFTVGLYLITLAIVGSGTPFEMTRNLQAWFNLREGTIWDEVLYSTTYKPYLLFDVRQYPVRDYVEAQWVDIASAFITYEVIFSRGVAILCIVGAWFYPAAVSSRRLVFFVLMQSFMGQNPGGYAITFIVFLVFMDQKKNFAVRLAIVCCYFVSIPYDVNITSIIEVERQSWLSGRMVQSLYALPMGALIRPGLLLIILWSFAIDSLVDLHRAVKRSRPILGLASFQVVGHHEGRIASAGVA